MNWHHIIDSVTVVLIVLLGVYALLKFAFFLLPYSKRRAALDRAYGDRPSATRTSDPVRLALAVVIAALLLWRGIEPVGFLGGLLIGATLIQIYFHRFHTPLAPDRSPLPVVSPIKVMSYAIQDAPGRPWREILLMAVLIVWALALIVSPWL